MPRLKSILQSAREKKVEAKTAMLKLFAKLKYLGNPNARELSSQIDRHFRHLNLDNAKIHTRRILPQISKYINPNAKILVVGCCNLVELNEFKDLGFTNLSAIDLVSRFKEIEAMDMHAMKFSDGEFDLLYCSGTFHCTQRPRQLAKEFSRVVRPGGLIAITVPVEFTPTEAYIYDPKTVQGLHDVFGDLFSQNLWDESVEAKSEFNPHAYKVIRSVFTTRTENI